MREEGISNPTARRSVSGRSSFASIARHALGHPPFSSSIGTVEGSSTRDWQRITEMCSPAVPADADTAYSEGGGLDCRSRSMEAMSK